MSFRVEYGSLKAPGRLPRPLALFRTEHGGRVGVGVVVSGSTTLKTSFFPQQVIEEMIVAKWGREGYVYHEGFDTRRTIDSITPIIQADVPKWRPHLSLPGSSSLGDLLISQPGIDLWRMLCLALDHGIKEGEESGTEQFIRQAPPSLLINNNLLGTVLLAGNHRALILLVSGLDGLPAVGVSVPNAAISYISNLRGSVSYVEATFGTSRIQALAQSFIGQLEALEK